VASRQDVGDARWGCYNAVMHCIRTLKDIELMVWTGLFGEISDYFLSLSLDLC